MGSQEEGKQGPVLFGARVSDPGKGGLRLSRLLVLAGEAEERFGMRVQFMDPARLPDREFVLMALEKAEEAVARGDNVADDLLLELLRFASGKRQIRKALERLGVKDGASDLLVLLLPGEGSRTGAADPGGLQGWLCLELGLVEDEGLPERAFASAQGGGSPAEQRKELLEAMALVELGSRRSD